MYVATEKVKYMLLSLFNLWSTADFFIRCCNVMGYYEAEQMTSGGKFIYTVFSCHTLQSHDFQVYNIVTGESVISVMYSLQILCIYY